VSNQPYLLALNRMSGVGPLTTAKLLKRWPDLREMFELSATGLVEAGLPSLLVERITTFNWEGVEEDRRWQEKQNHHLLTWEDLAYPPLLREIYDPPIVLYARGDISAFNAKMIAMVGTRKPSVTGGETARNFARSLAKRGITIVSGLALGIDAQAHQGCLDVEGQTIAVMATGIDVIYPRRHQQLADDICRNGLILSEFPLKNSPIAGHFPRRNRIISGLSLITLIVEAAVKSGSLITARLAMEQNRDVMAIPGSIHNPQTRGCHYLLQQGAKLVTSVDDVLDELHIEQGPVEPSHQTSTMLKPEAQQLLKCIGFEVTTIDQMVDRTGLHVSAVTRGLAELEVQGLITAVTGGYSRCMYERNFV
jgi:DNA processing protein